MLIERIYNYFNRNPRLHVLFIFEEMSMMSATLKDVEWPADYVYKVVEGDWFNTKYAVENQWKDKHVVLLIPNGIMPVSEAQQMAFPLMDLLKANMEYRSDDSSTFMQQYRLPDRFRPFIFRHIAELQSPKVMTILQDHLTPEAFSEDLATLAMLSVYLGEKKFLDWEQAIIRMLLLDRKSEESKRLNFYIRLGKNTDVKKAVDERLSRIFGFSYDPNANEKMRVIAQSLKYNSITQLLAPSAADSYKALKVNGSLPIKQINAIYELGTTSRTLSKPFAEALDELASDIKEDALIDAYGIDAQYFHITERLVWPILKQMLEISLLESPSDVKQKAASLSLKFIDKPNILLCIEFTETLASYYEKVQRIGTIKLPTPQDYVDRYIAEYYQFDQLYRKALMIYQSLLSAETPLAAILDSRKRQLDLDYARIANDINMEWLTCIAETNECFDCINLPKQEDFYNNEYAQTDGKSKLVVIVSDALRYEVAQELFETLGREKHVAKLAAYRAMLPTETKYCIPSLLPHSSLILNGDKMEVDGSVLATIDQRTAHLQKYRPNSLCMRYSDYVNNDRETNREIFKRPLVYLFHDTIDAAGHNNNPIDVIDACQRSILQLASLVRSLHATMNVVNVIITADHGFLYSDIKFEEKDKHQVVDSDIGKKTRYYLTKNSDFVQGIMKFPLERVSGMKSAVPVYVAVPKGTNRIAASGGYNFAHGGASLQEIIIPIIRSSQRRTDKTDFVNLRVITNNLSINSSRIKFQIMQEDVVDMMTLERTVTCGIYQCDRLVSDEVSVRLDSTDMQPGNRTQTIALTLNASVSQSLLQLKIYDSKDVNKLNALVTETVKNNTIIEQDF